MSLGNVVYLTSKVAPDAARRLRHEPRESDVQSVNVVFESSGQGRHLWNDNDGTDNTGTMNNDGTTMLEQWTMME